MNLDHFWDVTIASYASTTGNMYLHVRETYINMMLFTY